MKDPKDILINGKQLSAILEAHKLWLIDKSGERANLRSADLQYADLRSADLQYADLQYADLQYADLRSANLRSANLRSANLRYADLRSADLQYADLQYADLQYAKNNELACAITTIVPDGDIIGWKKCNEGIVKLFIPAKAKRSNATGRKCRAEFAKDIAHFTMDGKRTKKQFTSQHNSEFVYVVGKIIRPDKWNDNRWEECSSGVHFFITRLEAERY